MAGPKSVAEPHKELRFTRGAQAAGFAVSGAIFCGAAAALLALNLIPDWALVAWWCALVPLPFALLFFRLAYHCVSHAYIILTPLGIEIFPFFNPRRNLRMIYWSEITEAEVNDRGRLVLHFDEAKSSGVIASLAPIAPSRRALLVRAVEGRLAERPPSPTPVGD